jgi:hypothetical protein
MQGRVVSSSHVGGGRPIVWPDRSEGRGSSGDRTARVAPWHGRFSNGSRHGHARRRGTPSRGSAADEQDRWGLGRGREEALPDVWRGGWCARGLAQSRGTCPPTVREYPTTIHRRPEKDVARARSPDPSSLAHHLPRPQPAHGASAAVRVSAHGPGASSSRGRLLATLIVVPWSSLARSRAVPSASVITSTVSPVERRRKGWRSSRYSCPRRRAAVTPLDSTKRRRPRGRSR